MRSKRALPLSLKRSADSSVFGTFKCSSEMRVPFVEGRRTNALLVSIARHVGFFLTSVAAAVDLAMSAKVKLPWGAEGAGTLGGDGAPDHWLFGFLSSLRGGGGPTLRTVLKAVAMAVSKGK